MTERSFTFEISANLQKLIGRELVPTDEFAIVEVVKNAYDAGATQVVIDIQPETEKEPGRIRIEDDGAGMSPRDFENLFMVAGYSERGTAVSGGRIYTGEKGIGRFATDRLGRQLVVITRTKRSEPLEVNFDWEWFNTRQKSFQEIRIPYRLRADFPSRFGFVHGTIYEISRLRSIWSAEKVEGLRDSLSDLLNPLNPPKNFVVKLEIAGRPRLSGRVTADAPTNPDWRLVFEVGGRGTLKWKLVRGDRNGNQTWREEEPKVELQKLVGLKGTFLYFNKKPNKDQTAGLSDGVHIYRDGFRIEPFGSRSADWLGLTEHRAKRAGHAHLVPNRLFGFVEISRSAHPTLQDTTSRQALVDTAEVQALVSLLKAQAARLDENIRTRVTEPRWKERGAKKVIQLERARLHTLGMMSFGLAHEMRQPLQTIRSEVDNIVTRLKELKVRDDDLDESASAINEDIGRINETIELISDIATGDLEDVETFDLAELARRECRIFGTRTKALGIELRVEIPESQPAAINKTTFSTVLLNLWKNAVEAIQETGRPSSGRVTVQLSRTPTGHRLMVSDNGVGMTDSVKKRIFKKFTTQKTGGLGVGLYYCNLIVDINGGRVTFDSTEGRGTSFNVFLPDRGRAGK